MHMSEFPALISCYGIIANYATYLCCLSDYKPQWIELCGFNIESLNC